MAGRDLEAIAKKEGIGSIKSPGLTRSALGWCFPAWVDSYDLAEQAKKLVEEVEKKSIQVSDLAARSYLLKSRARHERLRTLTHRADNWDHLIGPIAAVTEGVATSMGYTNPPMYAAGGGANLLEEGVEFLLTRIPLMVHAFRQRKTDPTIAFRLAPLIKADLIGFFVPGGSDLYDGLNAYVELYEEVVREDARLELIQERKQLT